LSGLNKCETQSGLSTRTPEERRYLEELRAWRKEESGYRFILLALLFSQAYPVADRETTIVTVFT
jgi:hypothetical protein